MTQSQTCPICKKSFKDPKHPNKICCSRTCGGITRRKRTEYTCSVCGSKFNDLITKERSYCSRKCQGEIRRGTGKYGQRICHFCGKSFPVPSHTPKQQYCSKRCFGKGASVKKGKRIRSTKIFICTHCSKKFTRIARPERTYLYCSRKCCYAYMRGPNHRFWKGGADRYYGPNWDEQREKALRRDTYRCRHCNSLDNLCIHHLINRREFKQDWEAMNALSNLVTLCSPCHTRLHHQPTKTWNVKAAFELYGSLTRALPVRAWD